jgi:hypothetical protein
MRLNKGWIDRPNYYKEYHAVMHDSQGNQILMMLPLLDDQEYSAYQVATRMESYDEGWICDIGTISMGKVTTKPIPRRGILNGKGISRYLNKIGSLTPGSMVLGGGQAKCA